MMYLFMFLLIVLSIFLILLVLIQRGRGGGLAGAFGGMGGQSAFGAKAGDLFTRITIGVAGGWILLCAITVWWMGGHRAATTSKLGSGPAAPADASPSPGQSTAPATAPDSQPGASPSDTGPQSAAPATPATPAAPAGQGSSAPAGKPGS